MKQPAETYTIHLPQFEGPFDLLLFFIERDELDINNIPIAKITDDFLSYIKQMERLNVDLASEFILVAATLCRIKAKMLIPRQPVDEDGNEIDPREELIRRLMEYKRYKSVIDDMAKMEEDRSNRTTRGYAAKELSKIANKALADVELESVNLFKILKTFERLLQKMEDRQARVVHRVVNFSYTVSAQREFILKKVLKKKLNFVGIFDKMENRVHAIVTFLALLELLNLHKIIILQGEGINNFWIEPRADIPSVSDEEKETSGEEE